MDRGKDGAGVAYDTGIDLDQLEQQAGKRPVSQRFGQPQIGKKEAEVVGQGVKLQPAVRLRSASDARLLAVAIPTVSNRFIWDVDAASPSMA